MACLWYIISLYGLPSLTSLQALLRSQDKDKMLFQNQPQKIVKGEPKI